MTSLYEHAGGEAGLHRLEDLFYSKVLADPLLHPLFGDGRPDHVAHLTWFTAESFGGPDRFTRELGFEHLIDVHRGLQITERQRARFVALYLAALDEAGMPHDSPFRDAVQSHVEFGSRVAMQNSNATGEQDLHPLREVPRWTWADAPEPFPGHDGGAWEPLESQVVCSWPAGHFVENVAVDRDGAVFASIHSHHRIDRYNPADKTLNTFAEFPCPVAGLAFDHDGVLWATGGELGQAPGYIWRVMPDGSYDEWAEIEDAVFLNGCALQPDRHLLLVCESLTGRVLTVDLRRADTWRTWLHDELLAPERAGMPGANGIKVSHERAWISVTARDLLLSASICTDGSSGPLQRAAEQLRADDFAFAASGALYVATHPANTVIRLAADGMRTTIAGPSQGAVGTTACAFGRGCGDLNALYVTTNGGMTIPYRGELQTAKLLRIDVGERSL